ncbi:MAG: lipocalin family protein [Alistipes sp.]
MRTIFLLPALFATLLLGGCQSKHNSLTGVIGDATVNTLTVVTTDGDKVTFGTMDADRSDCHGLLIGSPVTIEYAGDIENGIGTAVSVATSREYNLLVGDWTYRNGDFEQGFSLRIEGEAEQIGTATLLYSAWQIEDDTLSLAGRSIGNGQEFDFIETWTIAALDEDTLKLEGENGSSLTLTRKR